MAEKPRIYHNPRCSKSRQALDLLREKGLEPEVMHYLDTPPTREDVLALMDKLDAPWQLVREKEASFRESGFCPSNSGPEEIAAAIEAQPIVLERPIVVQGDRAVIARPPRLLEQWLI